MALPLTLSSLDETLRHEIKKTCIVKPAKTQYNDDPKPVQCFAVNVEEDTVYVPLGAWKSFVDPDSFPAYNHFTRTNVECSRELYTLETDPKGYRDQNVVCQEALEILESNHVVFLALATGFGKTSCGIYFTAHFKLKTAMISHLTTINEQWADEYSKITNAKVQIVKGNKGLDPTADVYIIGVQKAATLSREELSDIGLVIFDEAHIATVTAFSKSLLRFQPKYVIGLSATPKRADGMHKLLSMYFGPPKSFIVRKEVKNFTVYKIETEFKPEIRYVMVKGAMVPDWTTIINSIEYNDERQQLIADIALEKLEERTLILCSRQEQSKGIRDKLVEAGENVRLLIGERSVKKEPGTPRAKRVSKKKDNPGGPVPRITVAGTKKAGTGFDDPTLTMLILASDCKTVAQWEGRIRCTDNIIYDLVDNYSTFENHWKIREAWYLERGATIVVVKRRSSKGVNSMPSKRLLGPNL